MPAAALPLLGRLLEVHLVASRVADLDELLEQTARVRRMARGILSDGNIVLELRVLRRCDLRRELPQNCQRLLIAPFAANVEKKRPTVVRGTNARGVEAGTTGGTSTF